MTTVGRHVEFTARAGEGEALAEQLVAVAEDVQGTAGCEQYVVGRVAGSPDVVAVSERWRSKELMEAAAGQASAHPRFAAIKDLLDADHAPRVTDLELVGGVGLLPPAHPGFTHRGLLDSKDQAPGFGVGGGGEFRFPGPDLGLERIGVAHYRLPAGARVPFGHRHVEAEEVYLVLAGAGRVRIDDELVSLAERDAVRIGPEAVRAFEAGDEGMEVLAVGPRCPGDGELLHDWWTD